jgi:hypothetical protein
MQRQSLPPAALALTGAAQVAEQRHLGAVEREDTSGAAAGAGALGDGGTVGNERSAEPQECIGLERSAVLEKVGVEQRLLNAFMGRPNAAVERLKVRLK